MLITNTAATLNRTKPRYCAPVSSTGSSSSPGVKLCFVLSQRQTARRNESMKRTARRDKIARAERIMQQRANVLTCFVEVYAFSIMQNLLFKMFLVSPICTKSLNFPTCYNGEWPRVRNGTGPWPWVRKGTGPWPRVRKAQGLVRGGGMAQGRGCGEG